MTITHNRIRASVAGSCITPTFLAREMGRHDARDFCYEQATREAGKGLRMACNPYTEITLRMAWDLGFWEEMAEIRRGEDL